MFQEADIDSLMLSIRRAPGLVCGAGLTMPANGLAGLLTKLIDKHFDDPPSCENTEAIDLFRVLDQLHKDQGESYAKFQDDILRKLRAVEPTATIRKLAEVEWSACISLALDLSFESALEDHLAQLPISETMTLIENKSDELPANSIPIYRLLGSPHPNSGPDSLVLRLSALMKNKQSWAAMLRTCADRLIDAPLIVVGAPASPLLFGEFIGALQSISSPAPRELLFVGEESLPSDAVTLSLLEAFRCRLVDCNVSDVIAAINDRASESWRFSAEREVEDSWIEIAVPPPLRNSISLVPNRSQKLDSLEKNRASITDSLFRPSSTDWRPFLAGLDLKRTRTDEIVNAVSDALDRSSSRSPLDSLICIRGEAGVGKTTVLKRVALELSGNQTFVFWVKGNQSHGVLGQIRGLIQFLNSTVESEGGSACRFVLAIDDPNKSNLLLSSVVHCFEKASFPFAIVTSFRSTDFYLSGEAGADLSIADANVHEVPETLDEAEIQDLPKVLVGINATSDSETAKALVANKVNSNSRDILCSLWYLLPATREFLEESLRDEYQRLGRISDPIGELASAAARAGQVAKDAYEAVTVCSDLGVRLPIEVLVSSLAIDYTDWMVMTSEGRPLWGLLYDVESDKGDTIWYETRNHIVTNVLLNLVNGGVGHSGELGVLRKLMSGCSPGGLVYRNFIVQVLVESKDILEKRFSYLDIRNLFELAQSTLPFEDRLLEHHLGILISRHDPNKKKAHEQLLKALTVEDYPQVTWRTRTEHIHTSIANNFVIEVRSGDLDVEQGLSEVTRHLKEAGSGSRFDAHHSHVSAKMLLELATIQSNEKAEVSLRAFQESLSEIERGFQFLGSGLRGTQDRAKSIDMLTSLQSAVLDALPEEEELAVIAEELVEKKRSLLGYEVMARRMLSVATQSGKARKYRRVLEFLERIDQISQQHEIPLTIGLVNVNIDLQIRYLIQRAVGANWEKLRKQFEILLDAGVLSDDVMRLFYYAVTLYHCEEIASANAVFANLSRMQLQKYDVYRIRCFYTGQATRLLHLQCDINQHAGYFYAKLRQVGSEVRIRKRDQIRARRGPSHVYLGFALSGPRATLLPPKEEDLGLP